MLAVSLYEKFILFPVATQWLQVLRQHVEALADASFLYGTNRNASHATDAKFLVYAFGIIKGDSTVGHSLAHVPHSVQASPAIG